MDFVGKSLRKEFEGFGVFEGVIKSYDFSTGCYGILYEDGHSEESDFEEVSKLLANSSSLGKIDQISIDPDELFKDTISDLEREDDGTVVSSEATFTLSTPGYRGFKNCELNEEGDYVGYDDGTLVVYDGSLDTDSGWNRRWCKRAPQKETRSDEDDVSSHPRT